MRTNGLKTNRDAWNYSSSANTLSDNVTRMIDHFNSQVDLYQAVSSSDREPSSDHSGIESIVDLDATKFSWDDGKLKDVARGRRIDPSVPVPATSTYRPFHRRWTVAGREVNTRVGQIPRIFPSSSAVNFVIGVLSRGSTAPSPYL